ncbi:MAG: HutD family protein [Rhodobacteraceae bacterium]|nr:HutD family protein [Paracoccaceae bacterium]
MRIILPNELRTIPWRNGHGITREIAGDQDAKGMLWRLSLADVETDGDFSAFPGMARTLMVISGPGMILATADGDIEAKPLTPVQFSGDIAVTGRLTDGPVQDLNLIYRPEDIAARLTIWEGPVRVPTRTGGDGMQICFVLAGVVHIGDLAVPRYSTVFGPRKALKLGKHAQVVEIFMARGKNRT